MKVLATSVRLNSKLFRSYLNNCGKGKETKHLLFKKSKSMESEMLLVGVVAAIRRGGVGG